MVGVSWRPEGDDIANVCVGDLVAPDTDRDPLVVGEIDGEIAPVERLSALGRTEVLSNHQPGVSGHLFSSRLSPLRPSRFYVVAWKRK